MTNSRKDPKPRRKPDARKGKPGMSRLAQKNAAQRKKEALRQKAAAAGSRKSKRISDEDVRAMILMLCAASYPDTAVRPDDIAMELNPDDWQSMLKRVRLLARQLAHAGDVEILRKGEPVDPDDFRGVYRLRATTRFMDSGSDTAN